MPQPLTKDEVKIFEEKEEKNEYWTECESEEKPFIAVVPVDQGYMAKYDMYTIGSDLSNVAADEARNLIEEWVEIYVEEITDDQFKREEITRHAGTTSGAIWPLDKPEAREVAADLSEIVYDESNWESIDPRDAWE
ncbi:uncharacterized protein HHUB_2186 [Halobacterium hubeiense]|uniref:Uncharacterized protein n=1 Tax=Halobacterium hubeiense TaxID=1407499 RepID=A0A0U5ADX7_9EURY|nr:hypothetical protein [Halobacterium hubeiense]CQH55130.1 uncharacterized protein HHUB_2186 [Halobacterium hubeiense]